MRRFMAFVVIALLLIGLIIGIEFCFPLDAEASGHSYSLYVTARKLNGRQFPTTKSSVEAHFEQGDEVEALQLNANGWVEVVGGETGTVWCKAEYLSESLVVRKWKNTSDGAVNLRVEPCCEAKRVGRIKSDRVMRISAEVFGWGYIKDQGWVDLSYFTVMEEEPNE